MPNQGLLEMITVVATMTREAAGVGQQRMARTALPKTDFINLDRTRRCDV